MVSTGPASNQGTAGFAFTYGYVEMRARVPSGNGLWPSFWMLPIDFGSKPEIDIMQVLGYDPTRLRVHVHTVDTTGAVKSQGFGSTGLDLAEDWHVYLDGAEVWRFGGADVPSEPMYLVANLAVGGDYAGPPDPATVFPAIYQIDFIRIWQEA
jgi:beta-glucanase (GH16 family)